MGWRCGGTTTSDGRRSPHTRSRGFARLLLIFTGFTAGAVLAVVLAGGVGAETAAELSALVELFESTNGAAWQVSSGWCTPSPVCGDPPWFGLTCNSTGAVVTLQLTANNLNGTLPASLARLTALTLLRLSSNPMLGGGVPSLSPLTQLQYISLGACSLGGAICADCLTLPAAQGIRLYDNNFTGPFPFVSLPNLLLLEVQNNQLSGSLPTNFDFYPRLSLLSLHRNRFTGALPSFSALPNLTTLDVGDNQFTGDIPAFALPLLRSLDVSSNHFTGPLPSLVGAPALRTFLADGNHLTFTATLSFDAPNLRRVGLASVGLRMAFSESTVCSAHRHGLVVSHLDLSGNHIAGPFEATFRCLQLWFPNLVDLDLSNNRLTGGGGHVRCGTPIMSSLLFLSLAGNNLTDVDDFVYSVIPAFDHLFARGVCVFLPPTLQALDVTNNSLLLHKGNVLAASPAPSIERPDATTGLTCPVWVASGLTVYSDPRFYNYAQCNCSDTDYWNAAHLQCRSCPRGFECAELMSPSHTTPLLPRIGWYPLRLAQTQSLPASGVDYTVPENQWVMPCFPRGPCQSHSSICRAGHDQASLMCSRCLSGWFKTGRRCEVCRSATPVLLAVVAALLFLAVLGVALTSTYTANQTTLVSIALFWVQLTTFLQDTGALGRSQEASVAARIVSLAGLEDVLSFHPWAVECLLGPQADVTFGFWALLFTAGALVLLAVVLACGGRRCARNNHAHGDLETLSIRLGKTSARPDIAKPLLPPPSSEWAESSSEWGEPGEDAPALAGAAAVWQRLQFMCCFLLDALQFPLLQGCLEMLTCSEVPSPTYSPPWPELALSSYVRAAPHVSCNLPEHLDRLCAAVFGVLLVVGLQIAFIALVRPYRADLHHCPHRHAMGFYWASFRPRYWWWGCLLAVRKAVIIVLLTQLPARSVYVLMGIYMLLLASVGLHLRVRPYIIQRDNWLDVCLLALASLTYFSLILAALSDGVLEETGAFKLDASYLVETILYLNGAVKLCIVGVLARQLWRRAYRSAHGQPPEQLPVSRSFQLPD